MKSSERILASCAVVLTVVVILTWLQFNPAGNHTVDEPPSVLVTAHTNQMRWPVQKLSATDQELGGTSVHQFDPVPLAGGGGQTQVREIMTSARPSGRPVSGGDSSAPWASVSSTPVSAGESVSIRGVVFFEGTAPMAKKIDTSRDPECAARNPGPLFTDNVIVNANGTLRNVFIYVSSGLTDTYATPSSPVLVEGQACQFVPHVLGCQINQTLSFISLDNTTFSLHLFTKNNAPWTHTQPPGMSQLNHQFTQPEVMIEVKDEVHPWMKAYIGVLDHPFFAVTGADGSFAFGSLPPGDYTVSAWHEVYGVATQAVTVGVNEVPQIRFVFGAP